METVLILLLANFALLFLILIILFALSGKRSSRNNSRKNMGDIQKIKEQIL